MHRPIPRDRRAISKEGMAALGFALTVVMIGVTGGLLMQSGDNLSDGGPIMTASVQSIDASNDAKGQWLRIHHDSGSTVGVSNLTIEVSISDHRKRAELHGLPTDSLQQSDYDGNHLFTRGAAGVDGVAASNDADVTWSSGEDVAVRIEPRRVDLEPGETVQVVVRHEAEDTELFSDTVDVVDA